MSARPTSRRPPTYIISVDNDHSVRMNGSGTARNRRGIYGAGIRSIPRFRTHERRGATAALEPAGRQAPSGQARRHSLPLSAGAAVVFAFDSAALVLSLAVTRS